MNITLGQSRTNVVIRILLIINGILLYDISSSGCPSLVMRDTSAPSCYSEMYNLR
jgi:hypothetical protein